MAYIQINDVLDELRDEMNRLLKENEIIYRLLEKFRYILYINTFNHIFLNRI